ncbi:hypothetical protein HNP73_003610 [Amaricoccus macauensis]|uniref:Uncharacterized protein n=1 Tax=Amaricoccus macauensis TaxID=57001 RepID=A0A840SV03_9RHOB|nr:hypothetical protein [Amaricoccus macauensis]
MEGVLIKAQALTAWSKVDGTSRMFHPGQPDSGPKLRRTNETAGRGSAERLTT